MKFNKNEFGWKEKVSVNTNELVTKNDIPHYNETLITEISGDDYRFFINNNYFNMSALNIDETKSYIGKVKMGINSDKEFICKLVYDKTNNALIDEITQIYIYNHKSYDGTNFIEDENSAVITLGITTFGLVGETEGYLRLYEIDKLELDNNCLPKDVNIPNSLTVGTRIGDIGEYSVAEGSWATASGVASHAEGSGTTALGQYQHVQGKYNIEDTENKYAHIVGNGTSNYNTEEEVRSNAHTLDWNGNGWYAGKLTQEGTPTEDKDLTTKKYVDDNNYYTYPTILYDDNSLPLGYVDITTLETTKVYKIPKGTLDSALKKIPLKAPNDDGTWFMVDDGSSSIGWGGYNDATITVFAKSSTAIMIYMNSINGYSKLLSIKKTDGVWSLNQSKVNVLATGNTQEYTPTSDYNPATKKYVDDAIASQPQLSFDTEGNLVVTIGGVTKKFKEITE